MKKGLWAGVPPGGRPGRGLGWVYSPLQEPALIFPASPSCLVKQSLSASLPLHTDSLTQAKGPSENRSPHSPPRSWCQRAPSPC